ncbi:hypothetical protein B0H12DRAFT_1236122 [Mycena haematopus]|nr:hypothetical protein B0H12DRAFT_1236122 [Mycena haematopus]
MTFLGRTRLKPRIFIRALYRYVPQLPQEIIDLIIDNVDDMKSFQACSLVSWAFVPACRKRIFRDVCFGMISDTPKKLHEILLRSPRIALYIKDVTIHRPHEPNLWMEPGSLLPAVLSMLPHVNRFSLFGCWGDWLHMPPSLTSAIMRIISLKSLDRLHVLTVANVPASFLHRALPVRIVSLFYVGLDPTEKLCLPQTRIEPAYPEYLNLSLDSKVGKVLEYMQTFGSNYFSNVRRLAVNPIPNSINSAHNFTRVLNAVETTLERLDIQWHELHIKQLDAARYSHLLLLRTVQLHVIMETPQATIPKYLPSYVSKLRASNPLLSSLTFILHLPNIAGAAIPASEDTARLLRALDAVIMTFPALREVHWKVIPECSPPSLVPDYSAFVRAHLGRTHGRGILSVEQGYRARGAAVMPLLPYIEVWPHRKA